MHGEQIGTGANLAQLEHGQHDYSMLIVVKVVGFETVQNFNALPMARENGAQQGALHQVIVRQRFF
jgi:hypothetical protein